MLTLNSTRTDHSFDYELSTALLDVVPESMREIRKLFRQHAGIHLTIPQFRVLIRLRKTNSTNVDLAEHIGLSAAGMSRILQGLEKNDWIKKTKTLKDRREMRVELSTKGRKRINAIHEKSRIDLAKKIQTLNLEDKNNLYKGFEVLKHLL